MRIGVVGCGVVGGAVRDGMARLGHDVSVHDIILDTSIDDVAKTDVCFICVPTPEKEDGSCDTSIVEGVVWDLVRKHYRGTIAIKSTVVPGTTRRLIKEVRGSVDFSPSIYDNPRICFVPEFLREKSAFYDFTEGHDICVIGTDSSCDSDVYFSCDYDKIKDAHGHYPKKFFKMSVTEAELCKYFSNVFNAMRVIFANGFYDVCKELGADYTAIKSAMVERPTLLDMYLDCNENFRGFAGVCLPKDTAAFATLAKNLGVKASIFDTIVEDNKLYKPTVFDGMRLK